MNKNLVIGLAAFLFIGVGGFFFLNQKNAAQSVANTSVGKQTGTSNQASLADQSFATADLAKHATRSDCYTAINGSVYDITKFINQHPGGNVITSACGKDATSLFNGAGGHIHSQMAKMMLKNYQIGILAN